MRRRPWGQLSPHLLAACCLLLAATACGKKGNPLPPLIRLPAAPGELAVQRFDREVYARFVVPLTNVDGAKPADVIGVELYAITLAGLPRELNTVPPADLRARSMLVAREAVRVSFEPPPVPAGLPPLSAPPPQPGVEPGATVTFMESLTADTEQPVSVDDLIESPTATVDRIVDEVPRALVAPPPGSGPQRFYYVVALNARGRYGPHSALVPAPLGPVSGPPSAPVIEGSETALTLRWTPPADARSGPAAAAPDLLPARSLTPTAPVTTYDVYEIARNAPADAPLAPPAPLTGEPVTVTEWAQQDITLGTERCFVVRAVDTVDGVQVRGPASAPACAALADTFAPAPPRELVAVAVPGAINLLWEPSDARDLAGYLVLRGEAGSATLAPLTPTPVTSTSFRDASATAGVRYVYAIVAVDAAGNRSTETNRVEETAQ